MRRTSERKDVRIDNTPPNEGFAENRADVQSLDDPGRCKVVVIFVM